MRLLSSPRRRRRALRLGALAAAALAATLAVVLLPRGDDAPAEEAAASQRWAPLERERPARLRPADRAAINRTLARFLPDAVGRRDLAAAWELAGPAMRSQVSRSDWLTGEIPVFPYPVGELGLDAWKPLYAYESRVGLDVLVQPRPGARVGPVALSVEMRRDGGRWLVDQVYPVATWNAPDEPNWVTGPPDFAAGGYTSEALEAPPFAKGRLDATWLAIPAAVLGLVVLVPAAIGARVLVRRRRRAAALRDPGLPPLPRRG